MKYLKEGNFHTWNPPFWNDKSYQIINMTLGGSYMPEGTITYPTLGRGKSSSKVPAGRRYVTFSGGYIWCCFSGILDWQSCVSGHHGSQIPPGHPKKLRAPQSFSLFAILLWHVSRTRATSGMSSRFSAHPNWCLIDLYSNTTTDLKPHQAYGVSGNWAAQKQHHVVYVYIYKYIQGYIYIYILCLLSLFDMKPNEIQMNIFWY